MDILLAGKSALPCFKQEQTAVFYVQRRFSLPVEIIPVELNAIPVPAEKCSASSPEPRSPCHRNRVHLRTGMPFDFLPESRSDSTGFLSASRKGCTDR